MLDIKRIEVGRLMLYRQRIDVSDAIAQTVEMFTGSADPSRIKVVPGAEFKEYMFADRDRFVQVLTNLISNAVKHSPPDTDITIDVERQNDFIKFSVTDSGPGIEEQDVVKLFQVFQQVAAPGGKPKEGTGLGLAICKGIVEAHGGRIGVASRPHAGSTFWFELPVGVDGAEETL
jgi:signal transduction histidine kinase